jgi:hypothetical protein
VTDQIALDGLLARWNAAGARIAGCLRPGVSSGVIRSKLMAGLGLGAPRDLVALWSWRDGTEPGEVGCTVAPHMYFLGVDAAIRHGQQMRELASQTAAAQRDWGPAFLGDPEYWWRSEWIPVLRSDSGGFIACAVPDDATAPTPIWAIDWLDYNPDAGPVLPSLDALIDLLSENVTKQLWRYDRAAGDWLRSHQLHDRWLSPAGLL